MVKNVYEEKQEPGGAWWIASCSPVDLAGWRLFHLSVLLFPTPLCLYVIVTRCAYFCNQLINYFEPRVRGRLVSAFQSHFFVSRQTIKVAYTKSTGDTRDTYTRMRECSSGVIAVQNLHLVAY